MAFRFTNGKMPINKMIGAWDICSTWDFSIGLEPPLVDLSSTPIHKLLYSTHGVWTPLLRADENGCVKERQLADPPWFTLFVRDGHQSYSPYPLVKKSYIITLVGYE